MGWLGNLLGKAVGVAGGPIGTAALGALGAISGAKAGRKQTGALDQATQAALGSWNQRAPLRQGVLNLALHGQPQRTDLSGTFYDPTNPFAVARRANPLTQAPSYAPPPSLMLPQPTGAPGAGGAPTTSPMTLTGQGAQLGPGFRPGSVLQQALSRRQPGIY
jgi:hypothetical protein